MKYPPTPPMPPVRPAAREAKGQLVTPVGILFLPASITEQGGQTMVSLTAENKELARLGRLTTDREVERLVQVFDAAWVKPSAVSAVVAYKADGDQPDRVAVMMHSGGHHASECADWPAAQQQRDRLARKLNKGE
jgi:hypothetical protein